MTTLPESLVRFEDELEQAIRRDLTARRWWTTTAVRVGAVAAAAAVALGVLSALPGNGPSAVERAAAALVVENGAIVHVDMTARQVDPNGTVVTWRNESWQQESTPFDRREIETSSRGPRIETSIVDGVARLYDPATNTIYNAPPPSKLWVKEGPQFGMVPIVWKLISMLAGETPQGVVPAPEPGSAGQSKPVESFRDEILSLLRSAKAVEQGRTTVDGRAAIEIASPDGTTTYLVDADTYRPIRFEVSKGGSSMTLEFRVFEQLPADGNRSLFSLQARHPDARVDTSAAGSEQVRTRLYAHG